MASSSKRSGRASCLCDMNDARLAQSCKLSLQSEFHPNKGYVFPSNSSSLFNLQQLAEIVHSQEFARPWFQSCSATN